MRAMGILSKINAAAFSVPLILASLLLRALNAALKSGKRPPTRRRGQRASAPTAVAIPACEPGAPQKPSAAEVKTMRRELTAVLQAHEGSREVFRYLAHFEGRVAKCGLATLDDMPVKRLRRALAQFEAIVTNWSSPHLAELRSRMAVAVATRDSGSTMWVPAATISKAYGPREMPMLARTGRADRPAPADFQMSRQVEVDDDISLSRFEAAFGEWHPSQQHALATVMKEASTGS